MSTSTIAAQLNALHDDNLEFLTKGTPAYYADQAWKLYNTKELIAFANPPELSEKEYKNRTIWSTREATDEVRSDAVMLIRQAFYDAFLMGLHYKITKEIDEQHNVA